MAKITIDGKDYVSETLSKDAKAQLVNLNYVDSELKRLQAAVATYQTARIAYARALKEALESKN